MSTAMSNPSDLIPFGQAGVPAYLQNQPSHSTLDEQTIGSEVDRITQVDGGVVIEENGLRSTPSLFIDVVILDAMPRGRDTYRAYYEGTWKEGESTAPACYSADGKVPSVHAEKPQCANCANCPQNVSGSGANGEGRACGYFKHVAVAKYPELDKIYRLKVASRSLFSKDINGVPSPLGGSAWGFHNYAKRLQEMKCPWESVVTRVSLPKGQTHGFFFTPVGYVQEAQYRRALELQKDARVNDILTVELSASVQSSGYTAPMANALPAPPAPPAMSAPAPLPPPDLVGRGKWLADATLPQEVKNWIILVDDATAIGYLQANYPNVL